MRYFFIDPSSASQALVGNRIVITGADARHIQKVLRLKTGDRIGLFDGKGYEFLAEITSLSPAQVEVLVVDYYPATTESPARIVVAQGFLKEAKMDDIVRQLTELGISGWIPFMAERSVPRPDQKQLEKRIERWNAISQQSIKQCRRGRTLEISAPMAFEEAVQAAGDYDVKIVFWENEPHPLGAVLHDIDPEKVQKVFVMLGPEGGLTEAEVVLARNAGFVTAGLGPRILRAETATLTAGALVQFVFGDMGKKS
jgi:16S rRNA (uracil1498-N3)-methyltransferase